MANKNYEEVKVEHVSIEDLDLNFISHLHYNPEVGSSIVDILAFIAPMPLHYQILMLANILTISGYSQREIAEAMGIKYQAYRNKLLDIRKEFQYNADHNH